MLDAVKNNLRIGIRLLESLSAEQYRNTSVRPYHSSIGCHIRHILDIFDCVFVGLESGHIDLTARPRNQLIETDIGAGLSYFHDTLIQLNNMHAVDMEQIIDVSDDLGMGVITAKYTIAAALIQAHSHAIHHFASLGYVITELGIDLPHMDFGFNPTTPRNAA